MNKDLEKVRVPVAGSIKPQVNRYYLKMSRRYMVIGILLMVGLILYIVGVMAFFGDYVTYENLKYLSRDFSAISFGGSEGFSNIVYNGRENMSFEYFRGGMAMTNGDTFAYYDPSGILLIDEKINYTDPIIVGGEKYMLVYDLGGKKYSIYNQLTKIIGRETDGKIIAADVSTDGASVIVTRSHETRYVATLYNSAFNKVMNVYKDNYILDAAISPNGRRIIICSAVPSESDLSCEITICEAGNRENVTTLAYEHTVPLDVYAYAEGFVLLCDRGLYFYDYDGKSVGAYTFDGMSLKYADISESSVAIVGSTNVLGSENKLVVLSLSGEIISESMLDGRITAVYAGRGGDGAFAYVKTSNNVLAVAPDGVVSELYAPGQAGDVEAIVTMGDGAVICRRTGAEYVASSSLGTDKSE